jgi:hypothetical protein
MKNIQWKQSNIDYDKLNNISHKQMVSSLPKSDDWKIKISKAHKGKVLSEQTIEKLREAKTLFGTKDAWNKGLEGYKGKPHSEETKQKMREAALGKVISDKQKKDVSKKLSVAIIATNLKTGKQKEYKSTKDASTKLGLTGILHVLKGRSKQCGGYFFEYKK